MILSLTLFGVEIASVALFTAYQADEAEHVDNTGGGFDLPFGFHTETEDRG